MKAEPLAGTPPLVRRPRRVPTRAPGVGRRTTRERRAPRPLTYRRPAWRARGAAGRVAVTLAATVAVGTTTALAWSPNGTTGPSPVPVDAGNAAWDATASCPAAPDAFSLAAAFGMAVRDLVARETPGYRDRYYGLTYGYDVRSEDLSGVGGGGGPGTGTVSGTVTASYHGTAYEMRSGKAVSRSGTATATFRWSGCSWLLGSLQY